MTQVPRRAFLADLGMGFTGLALGSMLPRDGIARPEPGASSGRPHFPPRAKSVIWIYCSGGYSHLETFDPKPALNKYAGKTFKETPHPDPLADPRLDERSRSVSSKKREEFPVIFPLQVGFRPRGKSGIEISDWWPHLATCVDDIAFVRNMYTTDNDHRAENQMHTGRHKLDEIQPGIGAWVHYGLGSLNENLPQFVVLGGPTRADTRVSFGSCYLGPRHEGVPLSLDPANPLPFGKRGEGILEAEQRNEFDLVRDLDELSAVEYPADPALRARIRSYELAFRMQAAVPEALGTASETRETRALYGLDEKETAEPGGRFLAARRLVERGVRFVQVYPTPYAAWDSHTKLKANHGKQCARVDLPLAGLLKDLKQRGLLDETLVVYTTEFGRTPGLEQRSGATASDGRDHHPHGFTVWLAGGGVKGGTVHGATDELGFHAQEPAHYVTDLHATVLHQMGLSPRKLEVPGRKRLEIDHGRPIREILA
jgi:hypothetical protein